MEGTARGSRTEGAENWLNSGRISKEELFKGLHKGFELEQMDEGAVSLSCLFRKSGRAHPTFLGKERKSAGVQKLLHPERGCPSPWAGSFLGADRPSPLPPPWFVMLGGAVLSYFATHPTTWLQLNVLPSASFLITCCFSPASYSPGTLILQSGQLCAVDLMARSTSAPPSENLQLLGNLAQALERGHCSRPRPPPSHQ